MITNIPASWITDGKIGIPYRLDREGGALVPGRGKAGWSVWTVDVADVIDALRSLPRCSWMPGTVRLARCLGLEEGPWR